MVVISTQQTQICSVFPRPHLLMTYVYIYTHIYLYFYIFLDLGCDLHWRVNLQDKDNQTQVSSHEFNSNVYNTGKLIKKGNMNILEIF